MRSPEQLKGKIRNLAKEKDLHAQEILQIYMFERILERLSLSPYKKNFILKGGLLISSMIGVSERTTKDMDTTVRGIDMDEDNIERIIRETYSLLIFSFLKKIGGETPRPFGWTKVFRPAHKICGTVSAHI